jgi:tetratricopeptide (TPR) repeat protein
LQQVEFFTTSLGVIWHPLGSRLPLSRDPYQAAFFNVPLTPFPLAFALQASDLALGTEQLSPYYVAGAAARLRDNGPALLASLEWQSQKSWTRLGVASPVMHRVSLYGGLVNFKPKNAAMGLAFLGGSYSLDVAYSFAEKKIYSGVAFRLGLKAEERARRHLSQGMALAKAFNFRPALKEFERYSKYDVESPAALQIQNILTARIREEDEKIRRLLDAAADQERQLKYFEAALTYHAVLQLNRKQQLASYRLSQLQPRLEPSIQRKYNEGQRLFDKGNYAQARQIFENILLLRKNHAGAHDYVTRISDIQQKTAGQAYFRGVGYFNQQNFIRR